MKEFKVVAPWLVPEGMVIRLDDQQAAKHAKTVAVLAGDTYRTTARTKFKPGERIFLRERDITPALTGYLVPVTPKKGAPEK